jgi:hypothetical protein
MENPSKWILKKEISVGDLIAFFMAVGAVATAYFTLDKRIAILETTTVEAARETLLWREEVKDALREINRKIDKIVDGHINGRP